ncbi:hypothetical protein A2U01_0117262, partial [Trifolium medium]|nr:hypothetical protein [Trifolium medium]
RRGRGIIPPRYPGVRGPEARTVPSLGAAGPPRTRRSIRTQPPFLIT